MRTTLTLEEDVLEKARAVACQLQVPFKTVVNEALRLGLREVEKPAKQRRYEMTPRAMGLRKGYSLDNIQEVLAQAEGEGFR
jgi:SOS response regulatory protein OraA/RecX